MRRSGLLISGIAGLCLALGHAQELAQQPVLLSEIKVAPPTPIAEQKEELGKPSWDPQWDVLVEQALPPDLLSDRVSKSVKQFCPRFKSLNNTDRRMFWAYVFQALAAAEAGLVPTTNVRHTEPEVAVKDSVTKRMVRAEGLLQLTYMDANRYGCSFDWDNDKDLPEKDPSKTILQPRNNLLCGVSIMHNQIVKRHKPLVSSKSYWSTLQPGTVSYRVFYKQMANVPDECEATPADHSRGKGEKVTSVAQASVSSSSK